MGELVFPRIQKRISDFLYEEEGTIPRSKIITIGTMVMLLSVFFADSAFAGHRSHSSHRSHYSHYSHSSHSSGYHGSHSSHSSHSNHSNHSNATPEPVPQVFKPSTPSSNKSINGVSLLPVSTEDPNIILSSMKNSGTAQAASTPLPVGSTAGIDMTTIVNSGNIPVLDAGKTPINWGKTPVPAPSGDIIAGTSAVNIRAEANNPANEHTAENV